MDYTEIIESNPILGLSIQKLLEKQTPEVNINCFIRLFELLQNQNQEFIPNDSIEAIENPQKYQDLIEEDKNLIKQIAIIKLSGGLGTTMGLSIPKSLLEIKPGLNFLDIIVEQIFDLRIKYDTPIPLLFMNSVQTTEPTMDYLNKFSNLSVDNLPLQFIQSQEPKLDFTTHEPAIYPPNPQLEWCPTGHGDLYPTLLATGILEKLLSNGIKYVFISNADNLAAQFDLKILTFLVQQNIDFLAEVTAKTPDDIKGGQYVIDKKTKRMLLREVSQIPEPDLESALDSSQHSFFNTNNIWINLESLKKILAERSGVLELPLIKNIKNIDPSDKETPKIIQLETAMGSASLEFQNARVLEVPRSRFQPVKTHQDFEKLRNLYA